MTVPVERASNACDLCGSTFARELYTARDRLGNAPEWFTIAQCQGCGVLRTLPFMDTSELARFYPNDYWGAGAQPSQKWIESSQSEKTRFLSRCGLAGGKILDVGCGSGFFLRSLDREKWERFGVETGESACRAARESMGSDHVSCGTLIDARWPEGAFDVITFWSALEHMNQPRASLMEARRIIKTGGSLIVQLPNAGSCQARWFRGDWFALDAPRHRYHFDFPVLNRLLADSGFKVYRTSYFSKAHNAHALKQSLKLRLKSDDSSSFGRACYYLTLPLIKPFDYAMSALGQGATLTVCARAV